MYGLQPWWPAETPFEVVVGAVLTQNAAWSNVEKAIARLKTTDLLDLPALLIGSHLDTVRDAGKYDGTLGVLCGISAVAELHRNGERLPFAIEVVGFGDEEGLRYSSTFLGSRALAGTFDHELLQRTDRDGISMREAFREFGLDADRITDAARKTRDFIGYVEVHIEQGPVLEAESLALGVVSSIAGATRQDITIEGVAGHAGTVPMSHRHDAICAAAELISASTAAAEANVSLIHTSC